MRKSGIIIIFCMISILLISSVGRENIIAESKAQIPPVLEVGTGKLFSPEKGVKLSQARKMIIEYFQNKGTREDFVSSIKVNEITVKEAWDNNRIQLYRLDVDKNTLMYGVAIIRNGKVLSVLDGMPTWKVFLADLDSDSLYEIYTQVSEGSGFISDEIRGYNIATSTKYYLGMRGERDLYLFTLNKTLWVKDVPFFDRTHETSLIGRLVIKSAKETQGLYIKAVTPDETKNNLYPVLPKSLTIDMVGYGKQVMISDAKVIKKITGLLNSIELKPFKKSSEAGLMASSLGGLKITADNSEKSIYVHRAGALFLNDSERISEWHGRTIFYISVSVIDKLYEIVNGLQGPPQLKITLDNKNIGYKVTRNKWNGVVHAGEDAFKTILKKCSKSVPYIKLGKTLNIEFKQNPPDKIEIYDYLLTENGNRKYDDKTKVRIPAVIKGGKCTFQFKENPAAMLSSNSEDYKPGRTLRGFKVICIWSNKTSDECEYGFVVRTDARIK